VKRSSFTLLVGLAFVLGTALRLYAIDTQILIDDEWHGMAFVAGKSYLEIFSTYNPHDNTSPLLKSYAAGLLDTVGWSEIGLRAPALLAGIASLLVFPLGARRVVGDRAAVLFAFLVALSPFLVFYSRMTRTYSPLALVSFAVFLAWLAWMETARRRWAIGFVALSLVAIVLHPVAAVAAFVPMGLAAGIALVEQVEGEKRPRLRIAPGIRPVLITGAVLAASTVVILVPVLRVGAELPWLSSHLTWDVLPHAASLASGTASPWVTLGFAATTIAGFVALAHTRALLAATIAGTALAYAVAIGVARPQGIEQAIVLLRYAMPLVPVALMLAACGIDRALAVPESQLGPRTGRAVSGVLAAAGFALLFLAGPLPETYAMPNNFTNHSTFQGSYERHSWAQSDARHVYPDPILSAARVPAFYRTIATDEAVDAIVEYPYDICNYNSVFYFFQHFHRKRVVAGYSTDARLAGYQPHPAPDSPAVPFQVSMLTADWILATGADPERLVFRNMVNVADPGALVRSGADYLVLHRSLDALAILEAGYDHAVVDYEGVPLLAELYQKNWGSPVFEDGTIVVFRIPQPGATAASR
jgi:hypothetical protein